MAQSSWRRDAVSLIIHETKKKEIYCKERKPFVGHRIVDCGMQKGFAVVTAHILYGNLAVSGKNVKLTSWGGRLTETNEKPRLPAQVVAVVCCVAREWERWKLPSGARFTSVAGRREKVYICLCLFFPFPPPLFLSLCDLSLPEVTKRIDGIAW